MFVDILFLNIYNHAILKGLIIPGYILLSDKIPRGNVTKTHEGAEGVLVTFSRGFSSDSNI